MYRSPDSWQSLLQLFLTMVNGVLMLVNSLIVKVGVLFYGFMIILVAVAYGRNSQKQSKKQRTSKIDGPLNDYKIIAILIALIAVQAAMTSYGLR